MCRTAIRREWFNVNRADEFYIVPIGDSHVGNAACDEKLLKHVVARIAEQENCYWFGLGDYCEFINVKDKRFEFDALADWIKREHLGDLAKAQRDRFMDIMRPIAPKCLGLIEGNHEQTIKRHYERDIYREIVTLIKEAGGMEPDTRLALGDTGWAQLVFYRSKQRRCATVVTVNLHHGFVGGKLAGAKALNMQRWLWTHDADLVIFGHSHNTMAQAEAVEELDRNGNPKLRKRKGCYGGTFLGQALYSLRKGYFPLPLGGSLITIRPGNVDSTLDDIVAVTT